MPKAVNAQTLAALQSEAVRMAWLVKLDFPTGYVLYTTAPVTISYDEEDYLGLATLAGISIPEESREIKSNAITVTCGAVDPAILALYLATNYWGRPGIVYLATCNEKWQVIGEPLLAFYGFMDDVKVAYGRTATVAVTLKNRLADWERNLVELYTDADQQKKYPGDLGFAYVAQLENKEIIWPGKGFKG